MVMIFLSKKIDMCSRKNKIKNNSIKTEDKKTTYVVKYKTVTIDKKVKNLTKELQLN